MKKQLAWFIFVICLLLGATSCGKDKEETDERLLNKENKEAGERFLLNNAGQEGVRQTFSGLQYKVQVQGTEIRPFWEDSVYVTYTGKLIDGTVFTSATDEGMLLRRQIAGFQEGLRLMSEGSTYTLFIPYYLAYNNSSRTVNYEGKAILIRPYSVLIFEITLNRVRRN